MHPRLALSSLPIIQGTGGDASARCTMIIGSRASDKVQTLGNHESVCVVENKSVNIKHRTIDGGFTMQWILAPFPLPIMPATLETHLFALAPKAL